MGTVMCIAMVIVNSSTDFDFDFQIRSKIWYDHRKRIICEMKSRRTEGPKAKNKQPFKAYLLVLRLATYACRSDADEVLSTLIFCPSFCHPLPFLFYFSSSNSIIRSRTKCD